MVVRIQDKKQPILYFSKIKLYVTKHSNLFLILQVGLEGLILEFCSTVKFLFITRLYPMLSRLCKACGLYYKHFLTNVSDACTINVSLVSAQPWLVSSITIVSDAPNCGVTYNNQDDDRNSFIIQATGVKFTNVLSAKAEHLLRR